MNEKDNISVEEIPVDGSENSGESVVVAPSVPLDEVFTAENPLPVTIIEPETEPIVEPEIVPFAVEGYAYGTISDTYLSYLTGIVEKLPYNEHYVIWKSGDYSYSLAYGEGLENTKTGLVGSDLSCVRLYRDSVGGNNNVWLTRTESLADFSLNTDGLCVYSDLGMLPTVERGVSHLEGMALLFAVGFAVVYGVCHDIFNRVIERYRK